MIYSSFITGFERLVPEIMGEKYKDARVVQVLNGAVIYEGRLGSFAPFLNNSFYVIRKSEGADIGGFMDGLGDVSMKKGKRRASFRVVVSDQNSLVGVDDARMRKLEKMIGARTGNYVNRARPDIEYWVLKRSEGVMFFMERVGKHRSFDKQLQKGELREDLCYFLNYLSSPKDEDVFLDPFFGSGAIIRSRVKMGKFNMIFGIDKDEAHVRELRKVYKGRNNVILKNIDFFENKFEDGFVDKIVTDPPWGMFEEIESIGEFYEKFMSEAGRILKLGGRMVVLSAQKEEMEKFRAGLCLVEKYDILVSGKKAGVFVFSKKEVIK